MFSVLTTFFDNYISRIYIPSVSVVDIIEIGIMSFLIYRIIIWLRSTKAWSMLKGVAVIIIFIFIAYILNMRTIWWIVKRSIDVGLIAFVILLQPEIRRALEKLGLRFFKTGGLFKNSDSYERFSQQSIFEIVNATYDMAAVKTGALMVISQEISLDEYIKTGIQIDGKISSELLINTFEKDTPLHDGAVIIEGDRIVCATAYLPLSQNQNVSKELGTRHRAALGMSEETDAFVIVVSEETGKVAVSCGGMIKRNVERENLYHMLEYLRCNSGSVNPIIYNNKIERDIKTEV
ncbi:diadenylate cyclase CdaA [Howardella ureilytica]|nr:diadenylate cyclase CdaA [Lachnospiraceae bacterium]MDY2957220.1 diadenylate cyclase CdaA [Lachnospiraceae bacterium]